MLYPRSVLALYCGASQRRLGRSNGSGITVNAKALVMSFLGKPAICLDCLQEEILIPYETSRLIVDDGKMYDLNDSSYAGDHAWLTELLGSSLETPVSIDMQHCCRSMHYDGKTRRLAIISDDDEGVKLNIYDLRQMILLKTWRVDCIPKYSSEGHFSQKLLVVGDCAYVAFVRENAYGELRFINLDWFKRSRGRQTRDRRFGRKFWERRKFLDLFAVPEKQSIDIVYLDDNWQWVPPVYHSRE
ncbi:hypothetical protein FOZ60_000390 [Perkinsus olseni]|uniref:Uncharacterized protein n=1 Tax=Perkinsus olseni TaxID=32597 RepID=A0A7J6MZJ1_PEROL|nr:hypothetical protein FOZ60_000390 [Perkinsus olseni]KAF4739185.1 hypothetical protein FOZ62_000365 [Perkinsus olseni]